MRSWEQQRLANMAATWASSGGGGLSEHIAEDDPHPTYLRGTVASVTYAPLSHSHLEYALAGDAEVVLAAHTALSDPHSQYLTPVEGNDLYSSLGHAHTGVYAPVLGSDDNYVTDVEKVKLSNLSGINTGDQNLSGYSLTSHNHSGTYQPLATVLTNTTASFTTVQETKLSGVESNATADQTGAEIVTAINSQLGGTTWQGGGGGDSWTYVKLLSDFITSSSTAVDVLLFSFTPALNQTYLVEGQVFLRTATATVGPRLGVAWPTGLTDGVAELKVTSSATASVFANGNINAAVLIPVGGLPNTTQSHPGSLYSSFVTGALPVGSFKIQLASETAGTNVTMKAGSWFRYRTI